MQILKPIRDNMIQNIYIIQMQCIVIKYYTFTLQPAPQGMQTF